MRSRYSAYVLNLEKYLLATWHPDSRPGKLDLEADPIKWLGLKIVRSETPSPTTAIVEFVARYKVGGQRAERLYEISEFEYTDAWYYVRGKLE
jgi:SEC-C motif-containing protein